MEEALDNAILELKRVDHLFYVSLKYTRTVDVIRSVVQRIINALDFGLDSLLKHAKENKLIKEIPTNAGLKCELLKETYPENTELLDYVNFYLKLKRILRADYGKREEYRRHVTMISTLGKGEVVEVDIDLLKEYYEKTNNFVKLVRITLYGEQEEI
jgi:hypothetical protein